MIGRGVFGNPWLFDRKRTEVPSLSERLTTLVQHAALFEDILGGEKNFAVIKKHFKAYVNGFPGAKELRTKLMDTSNAREVEEVITGFIRSENSPFTKIKRYLKLMFS
jgi:tRNA-dihydrouridine synthase